MEYLTGNDKPNEFDVRKSCAEMVKASGECKRVYPEGVQVLAEMRLLGIRVDHSFYDTLLLACKSSSQWRVAAATFGDLVKNGITSKPWHFSTLCATFRGCGKWDVLMNAMVVLMESSPSTVDDISVGALLSSVLHDRGSWERVVTQILPWALRTVAEKNLPGPELLHTLSLCAYTLRDRVSPAWFVHRILANYSVVPKKTLGYALLSLGKDWRAAVVTYTRHSDKGHSCIGALLRVLSDANQWEQAMVMFVASRGPGASSLVITDLALSRMLMRSARWETAVALYVTNHLPVKGMSPDDPDAWAERYLIKTYSGQQLWAEAMRVLFTNFRFRGDLVHRLPEMNIVLMACRKQRQWEAALRLVGHMTTHQHAADEMTLVLGLASASWEGRFHDALACYDAIVPRYVTSLEGSSEKVRTRTVAELIVCAVACHRDDVLTAVRPLLRDTGALNVLPVIGDLVKRTGADPGLGLKAVRAIGPDVFGDVAITDSMVMGLLSSSTPALVLLDVQ